jgi:predicted TIM-barrel fold metal-dependent hydrolase
MARVQSAALATAMMVGATMVGGAQQSNGLLYPQQPPELAAAQRKLPKIDMHMHPSDGPRVQDGKVLPRECFPILFCDAPPALAQKPGDTLRYTLEAMDRNNIVLGYLGGAPEAVYKWTAAAPNRFIPSGGIANPATTDFAKLRAELKAGRLKGLGEITAQYQGIPPNDPSMEPIWALMEEFDTTAFIHMVGMGGPSPRLKIQAGHPQLLEEALMKHPTLRISIENAGFPFTEETIAVMYRYPTVYGDLSTASWIVPRPIFYDHLKKLIDAGLGKRLMFASDQMTWPEVIDLAVDAIQSAPFLSPEEKRDIFYNNAARFLRLDAKGELPPARATN